MSEPTTAAAGFGALIAKYGIFAVVAVLGAGLMAALNPPKTKRELFNRALAAFAGSIFLGGFAVQAVAHWLELPPIFDLGMAVHFLVGSLSWFGFAALARFASLLRDRGGDALANRVLKDTE